MHEFTYYNRVYYITILGTDWYMAPEVQNANYSREVDIYGLGLVLLEMCILYNYDKNKYKDIDTLINGHFYDNDDSIKKLENKVDAKYNLFLPLYKQMTHKDPLLRPSIVKIFEQLEQIQTDFDTNKNMIEDSDNEIQDSDIEIQDNNLTLANPTILKTLLNTNASPAQCTICNSDKSVTLIQVNNLVQKVLSSLSINYPGDVTYIHICSNCLNTKYQLQVK